MVTCTSNDFYCGLNVIFENEPYTIQSVEFIKPGKGQSFARVKMHRLLTGTKINKTFKSTDIVEIANILNKALNYSYTDNSFYYFIDLKTFEQYKVEHKLVSHISCWLQYNIEYTVTLWNDNIILVSPPKFLEAEVIAVNINNQDHTSSGKLATLSTGAIIRVPSFIQKNDIVKVDTRSGEYVSRIK